MIAPGRGKAGACLFLIGVGILSEVSEVSRLHQVPCLWPYEPVLCDRPPLEFTLGENLHSTERDSRFFPPLRSAAFMTTSGTSLATGDTHLPPA